MISSSLLAFVIVYVHHFIHIWVINEVNHRNILVKTNNNKGNAKRGVSPRLKIWPGDLDLWPWKSIGFQILLRTKYVQSLVKFHWRMLILECSQGCYVVKIWPGDLDLWPWKSIRFQTLLRTKYVPSLVKIRWRMLILVLTRMLRGKNLTRWHWPLNLKINRVPDSPKYGPSLVKIHWRMLIL
jgi:hypothetical protein